MILDHRCRPTVTHPTHANLSNESYLHHRMIPLPHAGYSGVNYQHVHKTKEASIRAVRTATIQTYAILEMTVRLLHTAAHTVRQVKPFTSLMRNHGLAQARCRNRHRTVSQTVGTVIRPARLSADSAGRVGSSGRITGMVLPRCAKKGGRGQRRAA